MNPFEFFIPQNITVGAGTLAKLPECAEKLGRFYRCAGRWFSYGCGKSSGSYG